MAEDSPKVFVTYYRSDKILILNVEIQELVLSFGDPFPSEPSTDILASTPSPSLNEIVSLSQRPLAFRDRRN
jgi:hypothetical protein